LRLKQHENSINHKNCLIQIQDINQTKERVDSRLMNQIDGEKNYWKNILLRIVAVVKSLALRGLPFRGDNELIGSSKNGNFLISIELISEFDPFLAQHINKYSNAGRGSTSYLSSTVFEEVISIMAEKVNKYSVDEIKRRKYFSIIVDSTPDITHIDQLSFIVRYVNDQGLQLNDFLNLYQKRVISLQSYLM